MASSILGPENSTDGGAWWATAHGVTKSLMQPSDSTFSFPSLHTWWTVEPAFEVDSDHRTHPKESLCLAKTPLYEACGASRFRQAVSFWSCAVRPSGAKSRPSHLPPTPALSGHTLLGERPLLTTLAVSGSWHAQPGMAGYPSSPPSTQWLPSPASGSGPAEHGGLGAQCGHVASRRCLSPPLTCHEITVSLLVVGGAVGRSRTECARWFRATRWAGGFQAPGPLRLRPGAGHFLPQPRGHAGAPQAGEVCFRGNQGGTILWPATLTGPGCPGPPPASSQRGLREGLRTSLLLVHPRRGLASL